MNLISIEGTILELTNGVPFDTNIGGFWGPIESGTAVPLHGFQLSDVSDLYRAMEIAKNQWKNATVSLFSAPQVNMSSIRVIGGLSTSNVWVVLNATVAISPIALLLRAQRGRLNELNTELQQAGILADIS